MRAYATNSLGIFYGDTVSFTAGAPSVTTQSATSIGSSTATGNGTIASLGSASTINAYGVCWSSTNTTPTTADGYVDNGSTTNTGSFTAAITGLTSSTTYYVRAYAKNSYGTSYGNVVTITTNTSSLKQLTLKLYLQGLWNGSSLNKCQNWDNATSSLINNFSGTIVDTLSVELHDPFTYSSVIYKMHGLELNTDGSIVSSGESYIEVPNTYTGSYRITIKHRNHLGITSAGAIAFSGNSIAYDFTDVMAKSYQVDASFTPTKLLNSRWMMYAGDIISGDYPEINNYDLYYTFNQNSALTGEYGYVLADLNGDGIVDELDLYMLFANLYIFFYVP